MKKYYSLALLIFGTLNLVSAQGSKIEHHLFELPDVVFTKIDSSKNGITYVLKIKQPLDHSKDSSGYFYQKVYLLHKGFDRPTVMNTAGYDRNSPLIVELTDLLEANQIDIEHRFFGESRPDTLDYNYLNFEQITSDLHHINQLFKKIYTRRWISTGISKGGTTTIMYRYFYPNDVDVSVPYVAFLNKEVEDVRVYNFLDTVGTDLCRSKIKSFQRRILENRKEIMLMLHSYSKAKNLDFTYHTLEDAFEYAVLEYPFSFWQWGNDCDKITSNTNSLKVAVENLLQVSGIFLYSDQAALRANPYFYQAATEMGSYGYKTEEFKDLLRAVPTKPYPYVYVPNHLSVTFDGRLLEKVSNWLKTNGHRFIYINGALDPYSALAVPQSKNVSAKWFFLKDKNHRSARISNMNDDNKEEVISTLEKWLSINIKNTLPNNK